MSSFFQKEFTFDRVCRIFFTFLLVLALGFGAWKIKDALIPFLIGWLIAAFFMPAVRFFQYKLKFRFRILAIFATIICVLGLMTVLFFVVVPPAMAEFKKTGSLLVAFENKYQDSPIIPEQIRTYINRFVDFEEFKTRFDSQQVLDYLKKYVPKLMNIATKALLKIFNLISVVFIFLYAFFIMLYYEKIRDGFFNLLPTKWRKETRQVFHDLAVSTSRYFRGQMIVASVVGVLFSIGFLIIGLPLAIPLGLFIGLLNMIPYAQFIGIFPTILLCALHSADTSIPFWRLILFCLMVFAIVQVIEDTILTPKIMGKVTGLNPAVILLCLSIGGVLFGIVGIIMALPLAPMLLTYYHIYILKDYPKSVLSENENDSSK